MATVERAWEHTLQAWRHDLKQENRDLDTIRIYTDAAGKLRDWLAGQDRLVVPEEVDRDRVRDYMAAQVETRTAGGANLIYRSLQQFFGWLVRTEEIDRSPMATMRPPLVPEQMAPSLTDAQLRAVLDTCKGDRSFVGRRDLALLWLLIDTGCRRGELAGLRLVDVDLDLDQITVVGKGRRTRVVPFGNQAGRALIRYLRMRDREKTADLEWLWLAEKGRGRLGADGIRQMLERRGAQAGVKLHAHLFRHTAAHRWQIAGGSESALMRRMGWRSPQMLRRYASGAADERARVEHKRLGLGDKL